MQDPLGSQESGIGTQDMGEEIDMQDEDGQITTIQLAPSSSKPAKLSKTTKIQKDMENCFGFDEVRIYTLI